MKITVVGNSVGLLVRPPRTSREEAVYAQLLVQKFRESEARDIEVYNHCKWSGDLLTCLAEFEHQILQYDPDVVLVHFGINECAPRVLPRALWTLLNAKFSYRMPGHRYLLRVLNAGLSRIRPHAIRLLRSRSWMSPHQFEQALSQLVVLTVKETRAQLILLNIGPPTDRVERALPGCTENVAIFNKIISRIARESLHHCSVLDIHQLVLTHGAEDLQPDGIHLSATGHALVADQLFSFISQEKVL